MALCRVCELKLADTIRLFDGPFGDGVVNQITEESVIVFRPYATTADFSYTGGVIPYVGMETCILFKSSPKNYMLLERKTLK